MEVGVDGWMEGQGWMERLHWLEWLTEWSIHSISLVDWVIWYDWLDWFVGFTDHLTDWLIDIGFTDWLIDIKWYFSASVKLNFLPLVLLFLCALSLTVCGLLCIELLFVCIFVTSCVLFYSVCTAVWHTLVGELLTRSQYQESHATGHLGTSFPWFLCVYKWMLRWFPKLPVATATFSCNPPNLNFLDPYFIFMYTHYNHCHRATAHLQFNVLLLFLLSQAYSSW
jgi:hypothetical protein